MSHVSIKRAERLARLALMAKEQISQSQMAERIGVSLATLKRDLAIVDPAIEHELAEYRKLRLKELPIAERAKLLGQMARQKDQLMVGLKTIMYTDAGDGLGPAQNRQLEPQQGATISFPAGTRVGIVAQPDVRKGSQASTKTGTRTGSTEHPICNKLLGDEKK